MKALWEHLIDELGSVSLPTIKYIIANNKITDDAKNNLLILTNYWTGNYEKCINIYNSHSFSNQADEINSLIIIFYIYFYNMDYINSEIIYKNLKSLYNNTSLNLRYSILSVLCGFENSQNNYERILNMNVNDNKIPFDHRTIFLLMKSRILYLQNQYDESFLLLKKAYENDKNSKYEYLKIRTFNSFAYRLKKLNKEKEAINAAKKLSYQLGYLFNTIQYGRNIHYFDTLAFVMEDARHMEIFATIFNTFGTKDEEVIENANNIINRNSEKVRKTFEIYEKKLNEIKNKDINVPFEYEIGFLRQFSFPDMIDEKLKLIYSDKNYLVPVEKARIDMAAKFFKITGDDIKKRFETVYYALSDIEKEYVSSFIIQYSRYIDYKKYLDININYFYKDLFTSLNLDPTISEICMYLWDSPEMENVIKIFEKF